MWPFDHRHHPAPPMPDPQKAKAELDRVRGQRPAVSKLVRALEQERVANTFGLNAEKVFKSRKV